MSQRYLIMDFETRATIDLKKSGQWEYSAHPETEIMCLAWCVGTRTSLPKAKIEIWSPALKETKKDLNYFLADFFNPEVIKVAHNSGFEKSISKNVLPKYINKKVDIRHHEWVCTASLAAALALPRNLEGACSALHLRHQKDKTGHRLMLKLSKPRKQSKKNPSKWHCLKRDLMRLIEYCIADIAAERDLFLTLPPLNETERQVWLLDQKINFRGFQADRELVKATLGMIAEETINLNKETTEMTGGTPGSTTQRDGVLKWLEREGVFLPDLRAKTVKDALTEGLVEGDTKRLLQIRQAVSKTSTAKYTAFDTRSRTDGRVRDILVYHTASTGRWGGAGVQPQNFPRGVIDDTTLAAEVLRSGDLEFVRLIYGDPMAVFSSCLRSVIVAPKGRELFCADYAAIEARVLFWCAKHASGLKGFFENRPMYEEMAKVIYDLEDIKEVTKLQRQVGKGAFLGCGYGMGWKKFGATCKNFGMEVDEETSQVAVNAYRTIHQPVVKLWSNYERAAIEAVKRKGTKFKINHTTWWVEPLPGTKIEFLWCELPSKRRLAYFGPQVKYEMTPWEEKRAVLYHWGINPLTRKWESSGTYGGRLTENVVQAISRDLMADSMLRIEESGYDLILTVHDEILAERQIGLGSTEEFENLMASTPTWAEGCPVRVEGWSGPRYKK